MPRSQKKSAQARGAEQREGSRERQQAFVERRKAAGFERVKVWVPASRKAELLAFAAALANNDEVRSNTLDNTLLSTGPNAVNSPDTDPRQIDIEEMIAAAPAAASEATTPAAGQLPGATFSRRLRKAREAAGVSQKKLAGLVGVSHSLPGHWESGLRTPAPEILEKLVEILGIDP